jgi:hypothetical protein
LSFGGLTIELELVIKPQIEQAAGRGSQQKAGAKSICERSEVTKSTRILGEMSCDNIKSRFLHFLSIGGGIEGHRAMDEIPRPAAMTDLL